MEQSTGGALAAHPFPEKHKDPSKDKDLHCIYYLGLGPAPPIPGQVQAPRGTLNLNPAVEQFQLLVTNWVNRADGCVVWQPGMEAHVKHMKRKDLPVFVVQAAEIVQEAGRVAAGMPPNDPEAALEAEAMAKAAAAAAGGGVQAKRARETGNDENVVDEPVAKREKVAGDGEVAEAAMPAGDGDGDVKGAATDETATVERGIGETDGAVLKTEDEKTEDEKTAVEITDDDENADLVPVEDDDIDGLNDDDGDVAGLAPPEGGITRTTSNSKIKVSFASALKCAGFFSRSSL